MTTSTTHKALTTKTLNNIIKGINYYGANRASLHKLINKRLEKYTGIDFNEAQLLTDYVMRNVSPCDILRLAGSLEFAQDYTIGEKPITIKLFDKIYHSVFARHSLFDFVVRITEKHYTRYLKFELVANIEPDIFRHSKDFNKVGISIPATELSVPIS